jgi:hypothetical protein
MHDARDVEDKRLLEAGGHKLLLAGYFHAVRELCFLRLRDREAADEAAQIVWATGARSPVRGGIVRRADKASMAWWGGPTSGFPCPRSTSGSPSQPRRGSEELLRKSLESVGVACALRDRGERNADYR